jgi:hypothetical protein
MQTDAGQYSLDLPKRSIYIFFFSVLFFDIVSTQYGLIRTITIHCRQYLLIINVFFLKINKT